MSEIDWAEIGKQIEAIPHIQELGIEHGIVHHAREVYLYTTTGDGQDGMTFVSQVYGPSGDSELALPKPDVEALCSTFNDTGQAVQQTSEPLHPQDHHLMLVSIGLDEDDKAVWQAHIIPGQSLLEDSDMRVARDLAREMQFMPGSELTEALCQAVADFRDHLSQTSPYHQEKLDDPEYSSQGHDCPPPSTGPGAGT